MRLNDLLKIIVNKRQNGFESKSDNPKPQLFPLNQKLSNIIIMTHSKKYILLHDTT